MVIGTSKGKHMSFSAYGGDDSLVEWRKPTEGEIDFLLDGLLDETVCTLHKRLWVRESDEEMEKIKKFNEQDDIDITIHIRYQMTPEEKEEQRKWEEHADTLCDTKFQLEEIKDKSRIDKITYLENLLEEMKVIPPWKATREARQVYNNYLNRERGKGNEQIGMQ